MRILKLLIGQTVAFFVLFALCLFLPAGSLTWPAGWVFLILFFGFFVGVNSWLLKHNPGLVEERLSLGRADQKGWDKVFFPLLLAASLAWLAFIAFDASRFHWSPVPAWLPGIGALTLLGSFALLFLTFRENSFLSTVVRIQEERGHAVVSSGPYHYLRHPMYAGILLFVIGTSLLLGSGYGVLAGLIYVLALARRAVLEEHVLREELQGYEAYMHQVKYRLIPHVW